MNQNYNIGGEILKMPVILVGWSCWCHNENLIWWWLRWVGCLNHLPKTDLDSQEGTCQSTYWYGIFFLVSAFLFKWSSVKALSNELRFLIFCTSTVSHLQGLEIRSLSAYVNAPRLSLNEITYEDWHFQYKIKRWHWLVH